MWATSSPRSNPPLAHDGHMFPSLRATQCLLWSGCVTRRRSQLPRPRAVHYRSHKLCLARRLPRSTWGRRWPIQEIVVFRQRTRQLSARLSRRFVSTIRSDACMTSEGLAIVAGSQMADRETSFNRTACSPLSGATPGRSRSTRNSARPTWLPQDWCGLPDMSARPWGFPQLAGLRLSVVRTDRSRTARLLRPGSRSSTWPGDESTHKCRLTQRRGGTNRYLCALPPRSPVTQHAGCALTVGRDVGKRVVDQRSRN